MTLSLQTDYSLRTLMYLAARHPNRCQIAEIAEFFGISKDHLAKAVRRLGQEGYLRTIRGIGGGIELAKSAEQVSVGEVIERIEGQQHLLDCVAMEGVCRIEKACKLKGVLAEAERLQRDYLNRIRLSDVVSTGLDLVQLDSTLT
ncbi:MAG: Rrf2 family transcriptional regulator [Planctomycetaceae bacterium]|nr:Rrf2 family transcriptional regulator [Planctomycetaceae bacterium]